MSSPHTEKAIKTIDDEIVHAMIDGIRYLLLPSKRLTASTGVNPQVRVINSRMCPLGSRKYTPLPPFQELSSLFSRFHGSLPYESPASCTRFNLSSNSTSLT